MIKLIQNNITALKEICRKHSVAELYLFGSALTEDLENLFEREVDLVSYRLVKNPIFKEELERTKMSLYAAA